MSDKMPTAVWSGEIMGIRVYVLDDGRRIINAEDIAKLFELVGNGKFDPNEFAKAMASFTDDKKVQRT